MGKKTFMVFVAIASLAFATAPAYAQDEFVPSTPAAEGVTALTPAMALNSDVLGDSLESINLDIAGDGKIIIGWEDDSATVNGAEAGIAAGIRMYDMGLNNIPWAKDFEGNNTSSYYFSDGEPTDDNSGWGPKVRANWFGEGFGMGSCAWQFPEHSGRTETTLDAVMLDDGGLGADNPLVQLYEADGTPIVPPRIGATDAFAQPEGSVRIGDWCYLANGNIAISGEVRQNEGNVNPPMSLSVAGRAVSIAIVEPGEQFPSSITRVQEADASASQWGGVAPLANGFVVRYELSGAGIKLRYYDNDGNPTTGDVDLGAVTYVDSEGIDVGGVMGMGGRGDNEGMDTDADDRVVVTTRADVDGYPGLEVYACVLDGQGNFVVNPILVTEGFNDNDTSRCDAAIGPDGSFIVVWDDTYILIDTRVVLARIFNADGTPATGIFSLDDRLVGLDQPGNSEEPLVAWRGNKIAVAYESSNGNDYGPHELTARVFEYGEADVDDFMLH